MEIKRVISVGRTNDIPEKGRALTAHLSPNERVSLLEDLREHVYLMVKHEYPGRLQRVIEVINPPVSTGG